MSHVTLLSTIFYTSTHASQPAVSNNMQSSLHCMHGVKWIDRLWDQPAISIPHIALSYGMDLKLITYTSVKSFANAIKYNLSSHRGILTNSSAPLSQPPVISIKSMINNAFRDNKLLPIKVKPLLLSSVMQKMTMIK